MEEAEKRSSDQCSLSRPARSRREYFIIAPRYRSALPSSFPFFFLRCRSSRAHRVRTPRIPLSSRAAYTPPPPRLSPFPSVVPPPLPPSRARFIRCLLSAATSSPRARSAAAAALFGVPAAFARPTLRSRGARGRKGGSREAAAGRREEYRCRCMHIDGSNDDVRAASTANT